MMSGGIGFSSIYAAESISYYTSEAGLMKELTYKGKQMLEHWEDVHIRTGTEIRNENLRHALVVGTGATGGMAAKVLTEHGLEVLLLESGIAVKPSQFKTHAMPFHFPFRGVGSLKRSADGSPRGFGVHSLPGYYAEFSKHPYVTPSISPGLVLAVENSWRPNAALGPQSFRLASRFQGRVHDGYGANWRFPTRSRRVLRQGGGIHGVQGRREGLPQIPDGKVPAGFQFQLL